MSNKTPVTIDTEIAEQLMAVAKADREIKRHEALQASRFSFDYSEDAHAAALAKLDAEQAKLDGLQDLYTGWPRYWHVTNANGHIHTSQFCTSCFPDTTYGWRTDLSGLTPQEVVEREAHNACSVCMPIAPVEQRAARERYNAEQRQARKDEKQARADEKLRKAAERARKLLVKVEAAYESLGGVEAVRALDATGPGSLYSAVYGFGEFEGRKPLQDSVANVLLDDDREYREGSRYSKDPRKIIAEAEAGGLV